MTATLYVCNHPSLLTPIPNTHLVEILLSEVGDGFVNLQVVGQFDILRALHHVHTPGPKNTIQRDYLSRMFPIF